MEPRPDNPVLPGLVAMDLGGRPAPRRLGDGVGDGMGDNVELRGTDGPFAFFTATGPGAGGRPEPPAHRAGVVGTAGGLTVAGAVRLDARGELAAKLGRGPSRGEGTAGEERRRSDLELAAAAVERWGADAGDHLRGDFSLCAWDPRRRLFLAFRDPFGVLPLYLRRTGDLLLLSTSHRLLRSLPPRLDEPDEATLADFLLFGESVEPAATGWRGLRAVPAGHLLRARLATANPGGAATVEGRRHHHFTAAHGPASRLGPDEAAEEFREALDRAVADRLAPGDGALGGPRARGNGVAAAPVGVLASGGLDASLVAASLAHAHPGQPGRTYTFSFRQLLGDDSGEWARRVATDLGQPATVLDADHHLPWRDQGELSGAPASPRRRLPRAPHRRGGRRPGPGRRRRPPVLATAPAVGRRPCPLGSRPRAGRRAPGGPALRPALPPRPDPAPPRLPPLATPLPHLARPGGGGSLGARGPLARGGRATQRRPP